VIYICSLLPILQCLPYGSAPILIDNRHYSDYKVISPPISLQASEVNPFLISKDVSILLCLPGLLEEDCCTCD
jgi:hypothetical protein